MGGGRMSKGSDLKRVGGYHESKSCRRGRASLNREEGIEGILLKRERAPWRASRKHEGRKKKGKILY